MINLRLGSEDRDQNKSRSDWQKLFIYELSVAESWLEVVKPVKSHFHTCALSAYNGKEEIEYIDMQLRTSKQDTTTVEEESRIAHRSQIEVFMDNKLNSS